IVCTLPRHLLPPEKVYGCAGASHIQKLLPPGSESALIKPLPPGEVSAEPTERDDANKKICTSLYDLHRPIDSKFFAYFLSRK
ncbi:MAG: hypothetical protein IJN17_02820, partial [Clostridia bacterium]|nr:hypothetical protein [Clostridia bacterium]